MQLFPKNKYKITKASILFESTNAEKDTLLYAVQPMFKEMKISSPYKYTVSLLLHFPFMCLEKSE